MKNDDEMEVPALAAETKRAVSCGTLVVNRQGEILLCHVTGTQSWDIPKGVQEQGESTLEAARRELREETGLDVEGNRFEDIGDFDYRRDKRLHLYRVWVADDLKNLQSLSCTSYYPHFHTGKMIPEVDAFRWAGRDDIRRLCWPRMANRLLSIEW